MRKGANVIHPHGVGPEQQVRVGAHHEMVEEPHVGGAEGRGRDLQVAAGVEVDGLWDVDDACAGDGGGGGVGAGQ
jgi:hypothetical protein